MYKQPILVILPKRQLHRGCICKWTEKGQSKQGAEKPLLSSVMLDFLMVKHTAATLGQCLS